MIAFLTLCYCGLVWLVFFKLELLPWNRGSQGAVVGIGLAGLYARALVQSRVEPQSTLDRAEASSLEARLDSARLDLAEATVYAPAGGVVTNLVLRPGQIATKLAGNPVMTLIHDEPVILAVFPQQNMRHIRPGDGAEIALDRHPGKILQARVHSIVPATGEGRLAPTGTLMTFEPRPRALFAVRLELEDGSGGFEMPAGAGGSAAIYTQKGEVIRIVREGHHQGLHLAQLPGLTLPATVSGLPEEDVGEVFES